VATNRARSENAPDPCQSQAAFSDRGHAKTVLRYTRGNVSSVSARQVHAWVPKGGEGMAAAAMVEDAVPPHGHTHPMHRPAPIADNDEERIDVLRSLSILDTDVEEAFDRITKATAATLKVLPQPVYAAPRDAAMAVVAGGCAEADRRVRALCLCAARGALLQFPITLVSLVDKERQWFKSAVGLGVKETHRDLAFCSHVVYKEGSECMVVSDTWQVRARASSPGNRGQE